MVMLTTCPACHTRFRLTSEQLQAHGGDVRCGRCAKVFNANAYLEEAAEELPSDIQPRLPFDAPAAGAEPAPAQEISLSAFEDFVIEEVQMLPVAEEETEEPLQLAELTFEFVATTPPKPESAQPETVVEDRSAEAVVEEPAARPETVVEPVAVPEPLPAGPAEIVAEQARPRVVVVPAAEPAEEENEAPPRKRRLWLWLPLSLLLLLSLAVQALYFFRVDLAARYPDYRPVLQQLCGVLRCVVPLPANSDLLSIEASNLEADPNQANLVVLNAILRNRARFSQAYPLLELALTDTQDQLVARRIFSAADYAKSADLRRGMPPNEELIVKLYLDLGELKASGYRVFLFYPQ